MMLKMNWFFIATISVQLYSTRCASISPRRTDSLVGQTEDETSTNWQARETGIPATNNPFNMFGTFFKQVISKLKSLPDSENKLMNALEDLQNEFPASDGVLGALVTMGKKFLEGGYYISPETARDIIAKAVNHSEKEPDSFVNNVTKVGYKTMKTVGNVLENGGDLIATGIKTVKDLHNTQASVTNSYAQNVPYFGTVVQAVNSAISGVFEVLQLGAKFGSRSGGRSVVQAAETSKMALRAKKLKEQEENAQKANSNKQT